MILMLVLGEPSVRFVPTQVKEVLVRLGRHGANGERRFLAAVPQPRCADVA